MKLVLIAHNLRSCHNVGSLLRTADGIGVTKVYLSGHTPYPKQLNDKRLPHLVNKINSQIHKTALGAEISVDWQYEQNIEQIIKNLRQAGYQITGLEQDPSAEDIDNFIPSKKLALIIGREVEGIEPEVISLCDNLIEIKMHGVKESFNVSIAAAIAMYNLKHS